MNPHLGHQQQARHPAPSPSKLSAKAPRSGFQARCRMVSRTVSARRRHRALRSDSPRWAVIFASRSHGGPAHQARRRVHPGHGAQLPHAGIGLVVHGERALADLLESFELDAARSGQEPGVEERLGRREHRVAVDVMLDVLERLVAGAYRTHAAVTRERCDGALGEAALETDAEYRLQVPAGALRLVAADDVVQVAEIVLHRLDLGETVERPHHEERVPQPAVAIVPVSPGVRGLRDARGHRRDDRAGLLERAELQRDGGAGDRLLPLERQRKTPGPPPPVRGGLLLELAGGLLDAAGQRLVGSENQAHRLLEQERGLVEHVGDGGVGTEAQHLARVHVADVVRAVGDVGGARAVVEARAHPDADAGRAAARTDPANPAWWAGTCARASGTAARSRSRRCDSLRRPPSPFRESRCSRGSAAPPPPHRADRWRRIPPGRSRRRRIRLQNTGSASNRGRQHHTMRAASSTSAPKVQLPMTPRFSEDTFPSHPMPCIRTRVHSRCFRVPRLRECRHNFSIKSTPDIKPVYRARHRVELYCPNPTS